MGAREKASGGKRESKWGQERKQVMAREKANARTNLLQRSFFPQTIADWNSLNVHIKSSPTLSVFKSRLHKNVKDKPPDWYYTGNRYLSILHARMRMLCILWNNHLFSHIQVVDNPACSCGHSREKTQNIIFLNVHFILQSEFHFSHPFRLIIVNRHYLLCCMVIRK